MILAGGAGERFWPASRARFPKPLLALGGSHTLLQATLRRARRAAGNVWVVCGADHVALVRRQTGLPRERILAEPARRNTALALGLAATRIAAEWPDALVACLPADHWIPDAAGFARALRRAAGAADAAAVLVVLGVRATRPARELGWIELGRPLGPAHPGLHRVRRFVEKPSEARARRLLARGGLWNAGIFVGGVRTILEEISAHAPAVHRALSAVRRAPRGRASAAVLARAYRRAPSVAIDVAVAEKSRRLAALPVDFAWSDVGTWQSLALALGVGSGRKSRVLEGQVMEIASRDNLVWGGRRAIALVGVEGLAVVDTGDALLVTRLCESARVKRVVERLAGLGRRDLL